MQGTRYPLRRLTDAIELLVDPRVGIVQEVQELPIQAGAPRLFHYFARACNTRAFSPHENFNNAGGASMSRDLAMAKAVSEAVERYCAAIYEPEELPVVSFEEASFPCVGPSEFALYAPHQYEQPGFLWAPWEPGTPVRWTPALELMTGKTVHVPAAAVYMPYFYVQGSGEAPFMQPISTGMASHSSPAEAALGGLCEVIERDALMITWQGLLSRAHVQVESLSEENYELVQRFERTGSSVTVLDLTTDVGVTTILSVLRSPSRSAPALVFAASSAVDPEDAVRKSLEELAHTRRFCQSIRDHMDRLVPSPPLHENIIDQLTHLNFWVDHDNSHLADFIFASRKRVEFDELPNLSTGDARKDLEAVCRRVADVGHRALVVDLTTPDVRQAGLTVVRALIPGFHPLHMGYQNRVLGGRRLWEVPRKLGYAGITPETGDNPSPHMYP